MWWRPGRQRRLLEEILGRVKALQQAVPRAEEELMATAQEVLAAVRAEGTVIDSVLALLKAGSADGQTLDEVIAVVEAKKTEMEAAILAGTPSQPIP